jgi:cation transport ATPase
LGEGLRKVSFPVVGMSCAACARRVEEALSGAEGIAGANVNLAVERATVEYDPSEVGPEALARAVEGAGYGVVRGEEGPVEDVREREYRRLRRQFLVAAALTMLVLIGSLPMMLGVMVPVPER